MPPDNVVWLVCDACYADFRWDESPTTEFCAGCAAWHDWIAGAVVYE